MKDAEWGTVVGLITRIWPHLPFVDGMWPTWRRLLDDLDAALVIAAVDDLATDGREFAPPPGMVRRRAIEMRTSVSGDGAPDGDQALTEVLAAIRAVGIYGTPEWSHPAVGTAVRALGGWQAACMDDNPEAWRAHFLKVYGMGAERTRRQATMTPDVRRLMEQVSGENVAIASGSETVA